jgi:NADH:ubiquinone oxidoreductase subunit F (NADH-binding)
MKVIESMIIAAYAIGATKGYLYVRGEYTNIKEHIQAGIEEARKKNYLGENILEKDFNFDLEYRSGIGAYICGEETALIESIEGRAGDPRHKPPYTAQKGLFNQPTLVHNVETLVNILPIMHLGADAYKTYGTEDSTGTKLFSVSGFVKEKGVFETTFGTKLSTLIQEHCKNDDLEQIKFIQVGGSSGVIIPKDLIDIELSYEAFRAIGANLGSGAIFVADHSVCVMDYLKATAKFFAHESCGKCTPCREGNRHITRIMEKICDGKGTDDDLHVLKRTCEVMKEASFCGLGQTAPTAILSVLKYFENELTAHLNGNCQTGVCQMKGGDLYV